MYHTFNALFDLHNPDVLSCTLLMDFHNQIRLPRLGDRLLFFPFVHGHRESMSTLEQILRRNQPQIGKSCILDPKGADGILRSDTLNTITEELICTELYTCFKS